jgi:hypothetical protein
MTLNLTSSQPHQHQAISPPSILSLQMPLKNLLKNALPLRRRNHIPMRWHNRLKPPPSNPLHTLIKALPITTTNPIPQQSLLPRRIPPRIIQRGKKPRRPSCGRIDACLGILLRGGEVEEEVCFDEGFGREVVED